jgi:RNA polymerase sigma-70 factor (ECF subfamily)
VTTTDDAFEELYRRHAPSAFRRARRLLGNSADAHEVVHDVFLSLIERPEQYRGESRVSTFLYSTVTHACLNRLRNQKNRRRLLTEHAPITLPDLHSTPAQRSSELRSVLERMPEPLALVAVYYYIDDLSHAEIARVMGCSSRHVGNLLTRLTLWAANEESEVCTP